MNERRGWLALCVTVALAASLGLAAQNKDDKKKDEAQKREIAGIVKIVDDFSAGQPAPNDLSIAWVREDVLKAQGNKEYVPFTVSLDPSKVAGGNVALYWRVVSKNAPPPTAAPAAADKKDDKKGKDQDKEKKKPEYAYEDVSFVPVATGPGPMRVSRSFTVPAVTVPDFWNSDLNTSTVILAQRIDPLPAPLTPQQQADRPYALGMMEIAPTFDTKFTKKSELSTFMLIYNPKVDKDNKPDVMVEYNFCQIAAGNEPKAGEPCKAGEKFFNKTNPQNLNASTLPPQFDFAAGHQLQSGQAVPLASFPDGQYRLEIKVTDKVANKSLTRDVNFTVTSS